MTDATRDLSSGKWVAGVLIALGVGSMLVVGFQEIRRLRHVDDGSMAAPFTFEKWSGGNESLSDFSGKVVMLDFWATWCPPCVEEMPTLLKLAKEYEPRGLVFVAASRDEPATWKTAVSLFSDKRVPGLTAYAAYADDAVSDAYSVRVLPTLYFIEPGGKIHGAHSGYSDEAELRALIESALRSRDAK